MSMSKVTTVNLGIDAQKQKQIAEQLSAFLADSYTLYLTTHNFHWNVTGVMFNTLHDMFMEQYTELWQAIDEIAERIRILGFEAPGSYQAFSKLSSLPDAPVNAPAAMEMVRLLLSGHEALAASARKLVDLAADAGDESTADLLTGRLSLHEETAWKLRSLLQGED